MRMNDRHLPMEGNEKRIECQGLNAFLLHSSEAFHPQDSDLSPAACSEAVIL